ncbi:MFS transporter, partial [Pseudomonas syringae pv. tagetis]
LYLTCIFIGCAIGSAVASPLIDHGGWTWVLIAGTALPLTALLALLRDRSRQNA